MPDNILEFLTQISLLIELQPPNPLKLITLMVGVNIAVSDEA